MVDVTEKLKRQVRDWVSWADKYGISDDYEVNTLSLDMGTLRAMHSAREVDGEAIGQIKDGLIAARDRLNRAIEELIDSEVAAIAAMGEGDVR